MGGPPHVDGTPKEQGGTPLWMVHLRSKGGDQLWDPSVDGTPKDHHTTPPSKTGGKHGAKIGPKFGEKIDTKMGSKIGGKSDENSVENSWENLWENLSQQLCMQASSVLNQSRGKQERYIGVEIRLSPPKTYFSTSQNNKRRFR